jgi:hypothetical protein
VALQAVKEGHRLLIGYATRRESLSRYNSQVYP